MATPINVIIDNKTVVDDLESIEISQQEGTYCNAVTLSLKNKNFWSLCDPEINFGVLRIKVIIGSDTYQFLIEERDSTPTIPGVSFTVWGRSKQALLSKPYSKTINDTDDTSHPWQTANTTASAIVAHVISSAYCSYGVTVSWNVNDFVVYQDSFSVLNQSPIDVISSLAQVVGAELKVNVDGSLSVESYSVAEGSSVQSYNDLDDIVSLDESIDYPSGYNVVTVYGYGSGGEGNTNARISAERQGDGSIYPGRNHTVRVYHYHSQGLAVRSSFPEGAISPGASGSETITEDVILIFGKGNTSYPYSHGKTEVTGNESVPIATVSMTYSTAYIDFNVRGNAIGSYSVMFYFSDKSAYTVYSFTVIEATGGGGGGEGGGGDAMSSGQCSAIKIEKESPETVVPGSEVTIRIYAAGRPGSSGSSGGDSATFVTTDSEEKTEDITFRQGTASTEYPIAAGRSPDYEWNGSYANPKYVLGESGLSVGAWEDDLDKYSIPAKITYKTNFYVYKITVPTSWTLPTFNVAFEWGDCGVHSLDLTIDTSATGGGTNGDGTSDITINIKDYITSGDVSGALVYIDGLIKGSTDSNGLLDVSSVAVGDHTIKITKSGYQDSDLDDLANDSFTVTS